jgi:uncharacterized membrane protein
MARLLGYFGRGLVLLAPLVITAWVCWQLFTTVDGWLGLPIPGAGFVATLALITGMGFLGSTFLSRTLVAMVEGLMARLPFVRLLYGSTKDLLSAFVGERRRFDRPVLLSLTADGTVQLVGFITQDSLEGIGVLDRIAVYCPHSYNFSGQLYVASAAQVRPLDMASADAMAFVVSGGVTGLVPAAQSTGEFATVRL